MTSYVTPYTTYVGVPSFIVSPEPGSVPNAGRPGGKLRLPTDPVGTSTVTLTNVIDGSSLQIESQSGSTVFHNSVVSGTSKSVTLSVYAPGNPLNALRIKVRKGSAAPYYQPWETLLTATTGGQSVYVSQIPDQ